MDTVSYTHLISYTENGVTKTCTQAITIRTLSSISVTTAPAKTAYKYGEKFSSAGMVITAKYSDNATRVVTGWTYSPTGALGMSNTTITITYAAVSYTHLDVYKRQLCGRETFGRRGDGAGRTADRKRGHGHLLSLIHI